MTRKEQSERLNEIRRLYEDEKLSLREIAMRFGVTWQAIHDRLVRAKIPLRPKRFVEHTLESETLIQLYKNESLTITEIARRLNISATVISKELDKLGVEKRSRGFYRRKQPELYSLGIGDTAVIKRPSVTRPHQSLYSKVQSIGIRISVKSINEETMLVKRVK